MYVTRGTTRSLHAWNRLPANDVRDDTALGLCDVGELMSACGIARDENVFLGGPKLCVENDFAVAEFDPGGGQVQRFEVGSPSRCDEQPLDLDGALLPVLGERDALQTIGTLDPGRPGTSVDRDSFALHHLSEQRRCLRRIAFEDARAVMDKRDFRAESAHRLCEFDPHRPATNDAESLRDGIPVDCFDVRVEPGFSESGDPGNRGRTAGGDENFRRSDFSLSHRERVGIGELRLAGDEFDAIPGDRGGGIDLASSFLRCGNVRLRGSKIEPQITRNDPESCTIAGGMHDLGDMNEGFRGHAAGPEAITAGTVAFDEGNALPHFRDEPRRSEPPGPSANDGEVVVIVSHAITSFCSRRGLGRPGTCNQ